MPFNPATMTTKQLLDTIGEAALSQNQWEALEEINSRKVKEGDEDYTEGLKGAIRPTRQPLVP